MRGDCLVLIIYLVLLSFFQGALQTNSAIERSVQGAEQELYIGRKLKGTTDFKDKNNGQFEFEALLIPGKDRRVKVNDTDLFPFSAVVQIQFYCPISGEPKVCSGAMISPRTVLTAAHCVYEREGAFNQGAYCSQFVVTPGLQSAGSTGATPIAPDAWIKGFYPDYERSDYGLLILDQDIGLQTGWLSVAIDCGKTSYDNFMVCGFPKEKPMLFSTCSGEMDACARGGASGTFKHECDTTGGQSGSPMWVINDQDVRVIRAIHTRGTSAVKSQPKNTAVYISDQVLTWIKANMN